jgi:WD40 repeat protein
MEGHQDLVTMTHMTPDGKTGISASLDGSVRIWDLTTGEQVRVIENAHIGGVFSAIISPDGKLAFTGSVTDGTYPDSDGLKVWDLETGEMLQHYFYGGNSTKIILSPDGKTVYSGDFGLIKMDLQSGEFSPVQSEIDTCCVGFAFSSDGKTCYSATNTDTVLRSWDLETGKIIQEFGIHGGSRTRVELSSDDQVLMSSGAFGDLYLWEPHTGELLRKWSSGEVQLDIDMTEDGKIAISPGPNNSVVTWNLDLPLEINDVQAWIEQNRVVRDLSCEERLTYSIEPLCETE